MNAGIFRLVFNQFRGLWMVVSETAKSHQTGGAKRVRKSKPFVLAVLVLGLNGLVSGVFAAPLANTVPTGLNPSSGVVIHSPETNPSNSQGQLLKIDQSSLKGIIGASNFDIGSASAVKFNHTGGVGSATLVRISGAQTVIEGALNSPNGQIYLINPNGILFGNGARVDTNGLVASALNIKDSDFLNDLGHLYPYTDSGRAAYNWEGNAEGFRSSLVQVAPTAKITAALGSSVMLFAPRVINQGSIETTSGQVVMAAGAKVYLSFAPDTNYDGLTGIGSNVTSTYPKDSPYRALAGVLVEVDPYRETISTDGVTAVTTEIHGSVTNDIGASILAVRGNITMASYLVNQNGRATATTSVLEKGSIRLLARDLKGGDVPAPAITSDGTLAPNNNNILGAGSQSGELNFGENGKGQFSQTAILAEQDGARITDAQTFNASTLEGVGKSITINDKASIIVPGGNISLSAQELGNQLSNTKKSGISLSLGENTMISAAGLKDIPVSMDRNFVQVLLTTNDLQDDPLNKVGFLYHKNVWFDIRHLPDARVANLAGYIQQVPRTIDEKLTMAGTVKLRSEGDFIQKVGSVIDVSGGSVKYTAGLHKETWLQDTNGNAYAISNAPAGFTYTGFLNGSNYRTYYEHGYTEGANAGSLEINGYAMTLQGQVKGGAAYGEYQRNSNNLGGSFSISTLGSGVNKADISITNLSANTDPNKILLDTNMLNKSGFESINLFTTGNLVTEAGLNLALGTKVNLTGQIVNVSGDIVSRGGLIKLSGININVASGVKLDVSGNWTNDYIDSASTTGRVLNKGGDVSLISLGPVGLGEGSLIDVSGGGWLSAANKLTSGDAGSITIASNVTSSNGNLVGVSTSADTPPALNGELRAYALGVGGTLSLTAPFVTIGTNSIGDRRELWLTPDFFQKGGFASYSLTGRDGVLVKSGSQVDVISKNYQLNRQYTLASTGSHVADFSNIVLLPDYLRSSTNLSLSSQVLDQSVSFADIRLFNLSGISAGSVVVQTGASLHVEANGNRFDSKGKLISPAITLSAWDRPTSDYQSNSALIYVDGTLKSNGGSITLTMNGDPTSAADNDFNASQAIWLGRHAQLNAAGYSQLSPNNSGLRTGSVYDGGSITLNAKKGFIVAQSGSVIDVAGTSTILDVLNTPTNVASNGGNINLIAREGMLLDATFKAGSTGGLGGQLNVDLGRGANNTIGLVSANLDAHYPGYADVHDNSYPSQKWVIDVSQTTGAGFSAGLSFGDALQTSAGGLAKISADSINNANFSKATLKAADIIRFENNVSLNLPSSLRLDAPVIDASSGSTVNLSSANVMLSNALLSDADVAVRASYNSTTRLTDAATATLSVNAQLLDIRGQLSLSGFSNTNLNSTADIRLTGYSDSLSQMPVGKLRSTSILNMTARQIYPTTLSDFTILMEDGTGALGGQVVFNGTGSHDNVLSAGGKLTVNAQTVVQRGVLLAPFGSISLNATDLTLESGSLTSVAANDALIPFGYTNRDGLDYLYNFGAGISSIVAPPERVVKLNGTNVNVKIGSTIDVSAGASVGKGDLYAYEWVPGVGGSTDVLANGAKQSLFSVPGANASNTWAIMPASQSKYSSFDPQYWNGSKIQAGDAVYLSAMPGLAAGYYTLSPARYALLPGAFLVSAVSGHQDMGAGNALMQNDGSALVSGYTAAYTSAGYVQTSRSGGFVVRAGSDAHKLAEYTDHLASQRFAGDANVMQTFDAGRFSISADSSMLLDGVLKAIYAQTARGSEVDIAAPNLLIVNHGLRTGSVTLDGQSYLAIDEDNISRMSASSLLLGGTRSNGTVNMVASEVRIGASASISGPEVMLVAKEKVRVEGTAEIIGTGSGSSARDLLLGQDAGSGLDRVDGDGALLRVAGSEAVTITRNNTDRNRGDLLIESGATLQGVGALQLDSTHNMNVYGLLKVGTIAGTGALTLAAGRISLGNGSPTEGLGLTQVQLDAIGNAGSLSLKSYSTVDLYGDILFGNKNLDLTIQAAKILGYQTESQTASVSAKQLILNNANGVTSSNTSTGQGKLDISATNIFAGANTLNLSKFAQVNLNASKEIVVQGSGSLVADKALTLSSTRLTSETAADYKIIATNEVLTVQGVAEAPSNNDRQSQAAKLNLQGTSVTLKGTSRDQDSGVVLAYGANIDAIGSQITVQATAGNVTMENGASISAKGSSVAIKDQNIILPAGKISLISDSGNIDLHLGSTVDILAATSGDAGTFNATAVNGSVALVGTLVGGNNALANIDAKTLDINQALSALNKDSATGFLGSQKYHMRTGDAVISSAVKTQNFVLTADQGAITVNSTIDASGAKGGNIELYAKNDLTLTDKANLFAKGTADKLTSAGTNGNGGNVTLSSDVGTISANKDASIDVSGSKNGPISGVGGNVIMRASRTGDFANTGFYDDTYTGGVSVDKNATGIITGASSVTVEAYGLYDASQMQLTDTPVIDSSFMQTIANDTNSLASYISNNSSGLGSFAFAITADGHVVSVKPGVEIRSSGDLTLSENWNLGISNEDPSMQMLGGGFLTLRAANNLLISGNLDYEQYKINRVSNSQMGVSYPFQSGGAWSYRLISGADMSSSNTNMIKTVLGNALISNYTTDGQIDSLVPNGSIIVSDGVFVRTGSGFINVFAGGNLQLGSNSAIYTEGVPQALPADFIKLGQQVSNTGRVTSSYAAYREFYATNGGAINIKTLGDVSGFATASQTSNSWLMRGALLDKTNQQLRWWPIFNNADEATGINGSLINGVGALGGGDVKVEAGGGISNLQFASATSGYISGAENINPNINKLTVAGGGNVIVKADANINNVLLMAGKGEADVQAGGALNVKFELMDASAKAYAKGNLTISEVSNPTVTPALAQGEDFRDVYFYSYGKNSAVLALSASGDVVMKESNSTTETVYYYPGNIYAAAPYANVAANQISIYPSQTGNLTLVAGRDLRVTLQMSDVDPSVIPQTIGTLIAVNGYDLMPRLNSYVGSIGHMQGLLHSADSLPVSFYAGRDVIFDPLSSVVLPKAVDIYAGRDVVDANLILQNNHPNDVSVIKAGVNIRYSDAGVQDGAISPNYASLQVAGPGRLELIAGKDIDLGSSSGIRSIGNLYNPYLTPQGADVMVMPGAGNGPNYTGMINQYLQANSTMAAIYLPKLVEYMKSRTELASLTSIEALDSFKALDSSQQSAFINSVFYAELRAGGRDAIDATNPSLGDYSRSERAILTMFPNFTSNQALATQAGSLMADFKKIGTEAIINPGDLKLFYSQIRSEAGGDIELMVPSGYINSGLAVAGSLNKPATDLGIVSIRGGVIDGFVRNNFQVNQSRVFTLGGSDLMLYSALTNIDAGRGAKTSSATPPPVLRIRNGQITYDYSSAVSGSGIAALTATGGQPGTVDLFAPYGEINAGEAGIRSAGNINLGASVIIGRENISAGGVTSGAPVASVAGLSFTPVSAESNNSAKQGDKLSEAASKSANKTASALPSLITVEVLALGDDAASSSDPEKDEKKKPKKQ